MCNLINKRASVTDRNYLSIGATFKMWRCRCGIYEIRLNRLKNDTERWSVWLKGGKPLSKDWQNKRPNRTKAAAVKVLTVHLSRKAGA